MTSHTRTALVIGGGIAGPIVAMALRQAGIEATVYEAYHSTADGIGGGLSIAPNGLNALDVIGAGDVVRSVGIPTTGIVLHSWTGKVLGELDSPSGLPASQFVWRADLHRALYDEAACRGIRTVHAKRLVGAQGTGDGVTAHFADGTQASADILIGADGIRSTVRTVMDPTAPQPHYAGLLGFAAPMNDTGLASTHGKMHISYGKRASFGYLVYDDSSGGWFVNLPRREPMTVAQAREVSAEEWLHVLREAFTDDRTPASDMLRRTDPDDLLITGPLETMPTMPAWSRGRIVLIGDAVHAASPSSGQGASLAIESAVQLARCLRDLSHEEAFAAYERLRRARVERVIAAAARTNSNKASPFARGLRDLLMPVAMKVAMKLVKPEKMAWQFDYRIDWDAPITNGAHPGTARA
jgi:2-polyprenyl-6-methoxyphenol hydroxylase-like FAD-dependent oxidoreductase